jgi:hypothetical protein
MFFEAALGGLRARVLFLEAIIEIFSGLLPEPQFYANEKERAYRYENPDVRHFCLLKAARVVTALNAAIELVRLGYTQEMAALMRILAECSMFSIQMRARSIAPMWGCTSVSSSKILCESLRLRSKAF